MKKAILTIPVFLFAVLLVMPTSVKAQAQAKEELASKDNADITWDKEKHVFGSIEHKNPVIAEFTFTNKTKGPIVVTKVGTTCGCTAPSFPKEPVKPGDTGKIELRYDAVSPGFFKKGAKIHFSDGSTKEVEIEGKVVVRRQDIK